MLLEALRINLQNYMVCYMNLLKLAVLPRGLKYPLKLTLDLNFCNFLEVVKNNGKINVQLIGELSWQRGLKSNALCFTGSCLKTTPADCVSLKAPLDVLLVVTKQSILESCCLYFLGNMVPPKTKENVTHGLKLRWDMIDLWICKHNIFREVIIYQREN